MQGHQGGELTERGLVQAKLLGERLAGIEFSKIYVSDLNRTIQTAEMILKYHSETEVIFEKRIRERSGGLLEGETFEKIKTIIQVSLL
jgi:broad specificity phosphatase PhoE